MTKWSIKKQWCEWCEQDMWIARSTNDDLSDCYMEHSNVVKFVEAQLAAAYL